jgi:hypothetical protein
MNLWRWLGSKLADRRGHKAESDVEPERHEARSRKGHGEDGSYVGRTIGVDDALDIDETGAEARSTDK